MRLAGRRHRCPECAELVRREAVRCRFCGAQLEPAADDPAAPPLYPALFNLSGLGFGYLSLGFWKRAAWTIFGSVVLVLAALGSANEHPLLLAGVFLGWLLLTAFDAARLIAAGEAPPARVPWLFVALTLLALAAMLGVVSFSRAGQAQAYKEAEQLHLSGKCVHALERFSDMSGYRLAFSAPHEATAMREECADLVAADAVEGPSEASVAFYERFVREHPGSVLKETARTRAGFELVGIGREESDTVLDVIGSLEAFARALEGYRDTAAGAAARRAISSVWKRATVGPCLSVQSYDAVRGSADDLGQVRETAALVSEARAEKPRSLLACARSERQQRHYAEAIQQYERFLRDHPHAVGASSARSELIATRVDSYIAGAKNAPTLPPPNVSGSAASGTVEVTISNASPKSVELLFSGANGARSVTIPRCAGCANVSEGQEPSCTSGNKRTITVKPGRYNTVARSPEDEDVTPFVGSWNMQDGYSYSDCYYIRTRLVGG